MVPGYVFVHRFYLRPEIPGQSRRPLGGRAHCDAKCATLKGLREHPLPGYDSELSFSEFL